MDGFDFGDGEYSVIDGYGFALVGFDRDSDRFGEILIGEDCSVFVLGGEEEGDGVVGDIILGGFGEFSIETKFEAKGVHIFLHGFKIKILIVMNVDLLG